MKTAEEILDALESTDDGYIHYSVLLPVITRILSELEQAKQEIESLTKEKTSD